MCMGILVWTVLLNCACFLVMIYVCNNDCLLFRFRLVTRAKPVGWAGVKWAPVDDARLLVGVYQYGLGNWESIRDDHELGLSNKVLDGMVSFILCVTLCLSVSLFFSVCLSLSLFLSDSTLQPSPETSSTAPQN